MKAGDTFWTSWEANEVDPDGHVWFYDADGRDWRCKPDDVLPHHPALPAVAAWLAEHGDAFRYGQHTPGDWLDVVEAAFDEQDDAVDRLMLQEQVVPALRALLAALTTEGNG